LSFLARNAVTIESDPRTLIDNRIVWGPMHTALGFSSTDRDTPVGVEAAPFGASDVQVIGRVTSVIYNYNVVLGPDRVIDGVTVHHLYLNPVRDPQKYLLRELDVDVEGDPVRRLLYRRLNPFFELEVVYDFAPLGAARVWGLTRRIGMLTSLKICV